MSIHKMSKNSGFTLVEIAIVMLIFGLIIGGIMGPLKNQLENLDRKETEDLIASTKEAMIGFAIRIGRLPCPDTSGDGQENKPGLTCTNERGTVPWATLGVNPLDAWNQPLTYHVDEDFADSTSGTGCSAGVPGISFELCSLGDITIRATSAGATVADNVPAIIVSHGKNGAAGGGDVNEQENSDTDGDFVDKNHINQGYDDFVGWVNLNNLVGKMVSANKLP